MNKVQWNIHIRKPTHCTTHLVKKKINGKRNFKMSQQVKNTCYAIMITRAQYLEPIMGKKTNSKQLSSGLNTEHDRHATILINIKQYFFHKKNCMCRVDIAWKAKQSPKLHKVGKIIHACNSSTQEVKGRGSDRYSWSSWAI